MKRLLSFLTLLVLTVGVSLAQDSEAFIDQVGTNNTATAAQTGAGHEAIIGQGRFDVSASGLTPRLGFLFPAGTATDNAATQTQTGTLHDGIILQGVDGGTASGNTAEQTQSGTEGATLIAQGLNGTATSNTAAQAQDGTRHFVLTDQGFAGGVATSNAATQTQDGERHRATIRQGHGFWGDRPLQRSGAGESMTLQKALTSVLEANDIQAGVSIKDIGIDDVQLGDDRTRGGRGSAGREASAQLAIRKNKTQVQFRARPDVLSAVLADLEQNPNVACIQRMTIRRDSNSTMLDVTLVAQSWQTR